MDAKREILLDTWVLINFAAVGRLDLLISHPDYSVLITEHVRAEVKEHYSLQFDAVNAAVLEGSLTEIRVDTPQELVTFAELLDMNSLGEGECSAIAAAKHRSVPLAIDDRRARKKADKLSPGIEILGTEELMLSLLKAARLTVEQADEIKLEWETKHRFRLPFDSFRDRVP